MNRQKLILSISKAIRTAINEAYNAEFKCLEYKHLISKAEKLVEPYLSNTEDNCISYEELETIMEIPDVRTVIIGFLLEYGDIDIIEHDDRMEKLWFYIYIDKSIFTSKYSDAAKNVFVNSLVSNDWGISCYVYYNVELGKYYPGEEQTYWHPGSASSIDTTVSYEITGKIYIGEGGDEAVNITQYKDVIQEALKKLTYNSKAVQDFEDEINEEYLERYENYDNSDDAYESMRDMRD